MNTNSENQEEKTRVEHPAGEKEQTGSAQAGTADRSVKKSSIGSIGGKAGTAAMGAAGGFVVSSMAGPGADTDADENTGAGSESGTMTGSATASAADFDGSTIPVADGVTDDMSFNEAFAAAREETGPGGYFHYHGGWYGTYYKNEWEQFSPEYREAYSTYPVQHHEEMTAGMGESAASADSGQNVPLTGSVDEINSETDYSQDYVAEEQEAGIPVDSAAAVADAVASDEPETGIPVDSAAVADAVASDEPEAGIPVDSAAADAVVSGEPEPEIEVLGYGSEDVNGQQVFYAEIAAGDEHAALVDMDVDGDFDVAIVDNGTETPDIYEIEIPYGESGQLANAVQVENDMPDYSNDCNIDSFV
jgi:hypothetical protein